MTTNADLADLADPTRAGSEQSIKLIRADLVELAEVWPLLWEWDGEEQCYRAVYEGEEECYVWRENAEWSVVMACAIDPLVTDIVEVPVPGSPADAVRWLRSDLRRRNASRNSEKTGRRP